VSEFLVIDAVGWRSMYFVVMPRVPILYQLGCSSYLPLGVSNKLFLQAINEFSGAVAGENEDFCKGSLARTIFYFVIVLLYFIFACIVLSKIQKKIVSFIFVTLLLFVHYLVS
jgi:hypothetical protein